MVTFHEAGDQLIRDVLDALQPHAGDIPAPGEQIPDDLYKLADHFAENYLSQAGRAIARLAFISALETRHKHPLTTRHALTIGMRMDIEQSAASILARKDPHAREDYLLFPSAYHFRYVADMLGRAVEAATHEGNPVDVLLSGMRTFSMASVRHYVMARLARDESWTKHRAGMIYEANMLRAVFLLRAILMDANVDEPCVDQRHHNWQEVILNLPEGAGESEVLAALAGLVFGEWRP